MFIKGKDAHKYIDKVVYFQIQSKCGLCSASIPVKIKEVHQHPTFVALKIAQIENNAKSLNCQAMHYTLNNNSKMAHYTKPLCAYMLSTKSLYNVDDYGKMNGHPYAHI